MAKHKTSITISDETLNKAAALSEAERRSTGKNDTLSALFDRLVNQAFDTAAPALVRAAREETNHG